MRRILVVVLALLATAGMVPAAQASLPRVKHVWVIVLENENQAKTFGSGSPAPYLARTLRGRGELLPNYYGVTHLSLGNYIAMASGQGSNFQTQVDCQQFMNVMPGTVGADGQAVGQGCVYPAAVKTVGDQLQANGHSWRGYMEDMGNTPARESSTCGHPAIGAQDKTQSATPADQYATRHNPFVYFHSLLDSGACAKYDVSLKGLRGDLSANRVPSYTFITPNLCHDGHDAPCKNGEPGGLTSADGFLRTWIPRIQASRAYRDSGLIVINFDEAGSTSDACCGEPAFPASNTAPFATNGGLEPGPGGGKTGAVLLSRYIKPGSVNQTPYNHFSLLRSVEDLFGLSHLGYAAQAGLKAFGSDVYNGPSCGELFDRPFRRHGLYPRGSLVASASMSGRTLRVRMAHPAMVGALLLRHEVIGRRRLGLCKTYSFRMPRRHGVVQLRARRGALERRNLRF